MVFELKALTYHSGVDVIFEKESASSARPSLSLHSTVAGIINLASSTMVSARVCSGEQDDRGRLALFYCRCAL